MEKQSEKQLQDVKEKIKDKNEFSELVKDMEKKQKYINKPINK